MKDKGVYHYKIKTVYHFVDSNLGVEISSHKRLTEQEGRGGEVLEVVCLKGEHMTYLGEGRVCLRDHG